MNILLIGSGAREHALARAFSRSPQHPKLYCFSNQRNPGIESLCAGYQLGEVTDASAIAHFAQSKQMHLAVIGPEAALEVGVADALWAKHIPVIGPKKAVALIETSKSFARELMTAFHLPGCPRYCVFEDMTGAERFLSRLGQHYVIKANGLCGGKGVKVAGEHLHSHDEALRYCEALVAKGQSFVIEEKCVGEEFSLLSFSDGKQVVHMPLVQDHKRAFVGDSGPNTGGMGSYSCANHSLPFVTAADAAAAKAINELTIAALKQHTGEPYVGILYGGYMATRSGVKVIEFNARFGDPEAVNVLALLETDFVAICQAMVNGTLDRLPVHFKPKATVCKYLVPKGYPSDPVKNQVVDISAVTHQETLYLAAIDSVDQQLKMTGSRAIAVLGVGATLEAAERQAETAAQQVVGDVFYRPDIGTAALVNRRVMTMNQLRKK